MASITLQDHVVKAVTQYAERKSVSVTEAANMLIATGIKRLAAVHKWMDANKPAAKAPKAPKAPKAAKAAKAAKGTAIARKTASKAKAPKARKAKAAPAAESAASVQ